MIFIYIKIIVQDWNIFEIIHYFDININVYLIYTAIHLDPV